VTSARLLRFWFMAAGANPTRSPKRGGHAWGGVMTGGIRLPATVNRALHKRAPCDGEHNLPLLLAALVKPPQNVPAFCWPLTIQLVKPRTTPQKAEPSAFAKDFFYSLNERVSCLIDPRWLHGLDGNCGRRLSRPCRSHIGCYVNIRWARTAWIEITIHS
jgi:hypothetical protein